MKIFAVLSFLLRRAYPVLSTIAPHSPQLEVVKTVDRRGEGLSFVGRDRREQSVPAKRSNHG